MHKIDYISMKKPTIKFKSKEFTEVIELERKVTPEEEKRVDYVLLEEEKFVSAILKDLQPKSMQDLILNGQKK